LTFPIGYVLPSVFAGRDEATCAGMIVAILLMAANSVFIGSVIAWSCSWFVGDRNAQRSPRRFLQFSLRSLLIFVLLVSIGMSWLGVKLERARRQREAVDVIEELGGVVTYDYEGGVANVDPSVPKWAHELLGDDFFFDVVAVGVFRRDFGDDEAIYLKRLTNLEVLTTFYIQITDAGLEHLEGLTSLRVLHLGGTQVTDAGLEHLEGLTSFVQLDLEGTQITDVGLEHLAGLPNLQWLHLGDTQITDTGLEHLQGLTNLTHLDLSDTEIIHAGLEHLNGLTNLYWLDMRSTQVTPEGVKKLQGALPECQIHGDE